MKYLIMEDFSGKEVAFIFPRRVDHVDMREQLPYSKVISTGYLEFADGKFQVSGGNPELEVSSRPEKDIAVLLESLRKR